MNLKSIQNPKIIKQFKYGNISLTKGIKITSWRKQIRKPVTKDALNGSSGGNKEKHPVLKIEKIVFFLSPNPIYSFIQTYTEHRTEIKIRR